jgi:hypothetical protein
LLLLLASVCFVVRSAHAQQSAPERARLEVIEDLSESLANDLLELSVATRDRDLRRTAEFFPVKLNAAPYPARPQTFKDSVKWIKTHDWSAGDESATASATRVYGR